MSDVSKLSPAFAKLSKPAQRALVNARILDEKDLARCSRAEVAALHGIGPSAFPVLERALAAMKLSFKADERSRKR
jgi:hypothetical protein